METTDLVLGEIRGFMQSRALLTGTELDVFTELHREPRTAGGLAGALHVDQRGLTRVLDVLTTLGYLRKRSDGVYEVTEKGVVLSSRAEESVLPMAQHLNEVWKSWSNLTETVKQGQNPELTPVTERGEESCRAFIGAMHVVARELAGQIASEYDASGFSRLLDIGGASGTYTAELLRRNPGLRGIIFDLPKVVPYAEERMRQERLLDRVEVVGGDFYKDPLPGGCDLALLSAIIHQNSPEENVELYRKVRDALQPGGVLLIRDHIMSEDRLRPPAGAMFALNMLVNTSGGDTYTLSEVREQLHRAGFGDVCLVRSGESMDCLVQAQKGS